MGAIERRHKGSARAGIPKTAGPGGRRRLTRFWGALARTTASATLLPLRALLRRYVAWAVEEGFSLRGGAIGGAAGGSLPILPGHANHER